MLYSRLLRPLLFSLNPEFVHRQTVRIGRALSQSSLACGLVRQIYDGQVDPLRVRVWGLDFRNPVGLAAGLDKQGELHGIMAALGFGHMEVGSISLRPWPGNPSPTLLRLSKDWGLINHLGLNSDGSEVLYTRLQKIDFQITTGINLVKTADPAIAGEEAIQDYLEDFSKFYPLADFITLNLSCPNTVEGKTFEDPEFLQPFLKRLQESRVELEVHQQPKPVLAKLSPDLDDPTLDGVVGLSQEYGIDGFVIGNTTTRRENLKTPQGILKKFGSGGLSGRPLKKYIRQMIDKVFGRTAGRVPIIACGGIGCDPDQHPAQEVWEYLELGATLVQMYTGLIYRGPSLVNEINRGLIQILRERGISSLAEFLESR
ncbi:quinone-dependent dihydroorotate dehydrogenase [Acidobacteria bacterium AH-259-D05]|nr:quinone-dependent dihydroorotate dehydrogenase [Acidobacteria bacterium AH-259-D05]